MSEASQDWAKREQSHGYWPAHSKNSIAKK